MNEFVNKELVKRGLWRDARINTWFAYSDGKEIIIRNNIIFNKYIYGISNEEKDRKADTGRNHAPDY